MMVCGFICTGVRLPLLKCPERINAESYMKMIADGMIFWRLIRALGTKGFIWQQDNMPPYCPIFDVIHQRFAVLNWPPHSPNLSPIEMIWAIIKRKLKDQRFTTEPDPFAALEGE
jgi:hypothetical protein